MRYRETDWTDASRLLIQAANSLPILPELVYWDLASRGGKPLQFRLALTFYGEGIVASHVFDQVFPSLLVDRILQPVHLCLMEALQNDIFYHKLKCLKYGAEHLQDVAIEEYEPSYSQYQTASQADHHHSVNLRYWETFIDQFQYILHQTEKKADG